MTTEIKYDGKCKGYATFGSLAMGECFRRQNPTDAGRPGVYMKVWDMYRGYPTSVLLSSGSQYRLDSSHPVVPLDVVINARDA